MHEPSILTDLPPRPDDPLREAIEAVRVAEEAAVVERLLPLASFPEDARERVRGRASRLALRLRAEASGQGGVEAFMHAYSLSTHEGVMLMCLAEALLRIPDTETADKLVKDKIGDTEWRNRLTGNANFFVNASTYGLMLSGRVLQWDRPGEDFTSRLGRLVSRLGEPVVREALRQAMRVLGRQFVLGQTVEEAIERARRAHAQGFLYSFDMLGEAARTAEDARRYLDSYREALAEIGRSAPAGDLLSRWSLSIKLSALHPRYEFGQWQRVRSELFPALAELLREARGHGIAVTIDAEESERLEPSLDLIQGLAEDEGLAGWNGLGLAVQAYQKRALAVIDWLAALARRTGRRIPVRLVKGAYWDGEVKRAQQLGFADYPVFTRKIATDVSYLACARRLLEARDAFWPQFATHNAHTVAAVVEMAGDAQGYEFQKLHGMGEALYRDLARAENIGVPCRVYAPVGSHTELLPYLVRRLLENGANSSFVHQVVDPSTSLDALIADPAERLARVEPKRHPAIPLPADLYLPERRNARGIDLASAPELAAVERALRQGLGRDFQAAPGVAGGRLARRAMHDPADRRRVVGEVAFADAATALRAVARAHAGFAAWGRTEVEERARCLEQAAELMEARHGPLLGLCVREAGKTLGDAVADWREAIDFLFYYANQARRLMALPLALPGPTGEDNRLSLHPRGVFVAISPWNFPVAIFVGQVAAALASGNTVIAKPAEATSLVAALIVRLLHEAGVPEDALILLPGEGSVVGPPLVADPRVAGVVFTGSTETAWAINRAMAAPDHAIRPLIAETGGLNAMIVDSSALTEQVVADVVESAFRSAGQRCSALRVLFLQEDVASRVIEMLAGAMAELEVGDPGLLATDVGPVIDAAAKTELERHGARMEREGRLIFRSELEEGCAEGSFVAPAAFELDRLSRLDRESFGPLLHVIRFAGDRLDAVIEAVNATGYGLTFGIHSRIDETIEHVARRVRAGNVYVNRNIIGAVVGSQPFGGEGLSGTGFKAGGPNYLLRFLTERTVTVNTAAVGGNLGLLGKLRDEA
ncbi:MAG TPA: bifunctional proline dehydrogenase/L-glutamate gamma-semialdehyde dehydrogenase PutA [Geminicoccaceae bacterium]|nr:bifunctional proline dehydrogenase/L-glutamate gamma-semialdehyde dehydrogenase PutA [Geminicoccaceae bacterium]